MHLTRPLTMALASLAISAPLVTADTVRVAQARRPAVREAEGDLTGAARAVGAARSLKEASRGLAALSGAGTRGFPHLRRLMDDPAVHPEVRYHVTVTALRNPAPEVVAMAADLLRSEDRGLREAAARVLVDRADASVAGEIMRAYAEETDVQLKKWELTALGLAGDDPRVEPFLTTLLVPGIDPEVLDGVSFAAGRMRADNLVPTILSVLSEDLSSQKLTRILASVHTAMGRPHDRERLVTIARTVGDPLRLWAVDRLRFSTPRQERRMRPPPELGEAADSALDDPSPLVRARAALAAMAARTGLYPFVTDEAALARVIALLDDPKPSVRTAVLEVLHETALRRGIMAPTVSPMPIEGATMRMLRWPVDWIVFPALVKTLDDPDPEVRERAVWLLGITTGYWHGYSDIRLQGRAMITPQVKRRYREMWQAMEQTTPRAYVVDAAGEAIAKIVANEAPNLHKDWFRGLQLLTGQTFGWKPNASAAEKAAALPNLERWWAANRDKHPVEWLVDEIFANGFENVTDYNLHVLARWGLGDFAPEVINRRTRKDKPEISVGRMREWWQEAKPQLQAR